MNPNAAQVSAFVEHRIRRICSGGDSAVKAALANLRRGVGRAPGDMPQLWGALLSGMPEEFLSKTGEPTRAEWAIYTALTLFALHQQGSDPKQSPMNRAGVPLGAAVRRLVHDEDGEARVKRRFDAVATADGMAELANHLRGLVQLLKAEGVPLDYPALAADLYWYQNSDFAASVRLRWGQDFYRIQKEEQNAEGKE